MSEPTPYQALGVAEDASFEEIQSVKNRLTEQFQNDPTAIAKVEAAYDAIIMERLRLRQEGKIKVPERIRFPEKSVTTSPTPLPTPSSLSVGWLQGFLDTPSRNDILFPAAILALLAVLTVLGQDTTGSLLSVLLVAGVFCSLYFLNRKENRFGRAFLLTIGTLLLGILLAVALTQLLHAGGLTLGLSDEKISVLVTFFLFWLTSSFLR